jgi:sulfur-oxidizing protein SoxY
MGLALGWLLLSSPAWAGDSDPLQSPMWGFHQTRFLGTAPYEFDERVVLTAPPFAEDSRQVPISIDASALGQEVVRIVAWAELNPIAQIFSFFPEGPVAPRIALNIRVEQATPLRAAVLTSDGVWHVGSTRVDAAGGGCTAPSAVRAQAGWEDHLGEIFGARFPAGEGSRLRLRVSHPMDNGLSGGIPEFFIERAELRGEDGQRLASLELHPSVSENPTLTLQLGERDAGARLWLRDNNGNEFEAAF